MRENKLRDRAGATIVLALAVFLILTVFSAVMLTGAVTALRNATRQRTEEQLYLSAASAAALLQKRICGDGANVPYAEKVNISYDTSAYDNSSLEDQTLMDSADVRSLFEAAKEGIRTGQNLPDDSDSGYLLHSDSIVSPSPELYASPPNSPQVVDTQDLITYALCKMLNDLSTWPSSDCTITIGAPTVSGDVVPTVSGDMLPTVSDYMRPTSANLSMKKEGSGYLLTATLTTIKPETPSSEKATYVSKWTFSCTPSVTSESKAFSYPWEKDGYPETVLFYANIEKTVYKWKFETAERGEA